MSVLRPHGQPRVGPFAALILASACASRTVVDDVPVVVVTTGRLTREVPAQGALRAVNSTAISTPREAQDGLKVSWLAVDGAAVKEGDVVVRFDDSAARTQLADADSEWHAASLRLRAEEASVAADLRRRERAAADAQAEAELATTFQSRDEVIYSRRQRAESALDGELASARQGHAEESRAVEETLGRARVELLRIEVVGAEERRRRAERLLEHVEIRAPHDGVFLIKREWRGAVEVGTTLWPGQSVGSIPDVRTLEAEVFVLEADAAGLVAGRAATVDVAGHPDVRLPATVKAVETLAKPRNRDVPTLYFATVLELSGTPEPWMKPGQSVVATVDLGGGEGMIVPRQAVTEIDGKPHLWAKDGDRWAARAVTLEESTAGRVRIGEGVSVGTVVALVDPTAHPRAADGEAGAAAGPGAGGGSAPRGGGGGAGRAGGGGGSGRGGGGGPGRGGG